MVPGGGPPKSTKLAGQPVGQLVCWPAGGPGGQLAGRLKFDIVLKFVNMKIFWAISSTLRVGIRKKAGPLKSRTQKSKNYKRRDYEKDYLKELP